MKKIKHSPLLLLLPPEKSLDQAIKSGDQDLALKKLRDYAKASMIVFDTYVQNIDAALDCGLPPAQRDVLIELRISYTRLIEANSKPLKTVEDELATKRKV